MRLSARDVERKGWDPLTGFGVLDVGAALALPKDRLPIHDPLEPNDNLAWVDGRAFGGRPTPAIWSGGAAARLDALLDKEEDPVDVYRVVVGAHRSVRISAIPRFGDIAADRLPLQRVLDQRHARPRGALAAPGTKKTERVTVRQPRHPLALVLRRGLAAGRLGLPGPRVHVARRLISA